MQKIKLRIPEGSTLLIEKFINCMMERGKKSIARRIFRDMILSLKEKGKKDPVDLFQRAVENVKPRVEVVAKRIGGSVYQIPMEVNPKRQLSLALRWIISACRARKDKEMTEKLAEEIIQAAQEQGAAYKKKMDVFRMAEANKAFAHLAKYAK